MAGGKLVAGALGGLVVAGAVVGVSYIQTGTKDIEVHFFDKDKKEKKIRFSIEASSPSSLEVHENSKWIKEITSDNRTLYNTLFDVASKYLKVQMALNELKTSSKDFPGTLDNLCKDPAKCCCKPAGQQCDCKKNKCPTCLCCYLDEGKCCEAGKGCKTDEFKKTQKTFAHLLKNSDSRDHNVYLTPMQAYIKLPESSFDELKTAMAEDKTFIGTLAYGFSDYSYKPTKYRSSLLPKENQSDYTSLQDEKEYYFANVPQTFLFGKKDSDKETNIEKVVQQVEDRSKISELIKQAESSAADCCKDKKLDCIIRRNFVFLENSNGSSDLSKISEKIKEAEDCCK